MTIITTAPLDILTIPEKDFPFLTLTDNIYSLFSFCIKRHQKGYYNHFMWYVEPGVFISQDWILNKVPAKKYLSGNHRIKLITNFSWTSRERGIIKSYLYSELDRSWYNRIYDPLQIVGLGLGLRWLQIPGKARICSDHTAILKVVDANYNLNHPSPTEVNKYTKNSNSYSVYMRYSPD